MDTRIKIRKIHFEYTLGVYRSQSRKIHFGNPQRKMCKIHLGQLKSLISPNSRHTPSNTNRKWTRLNATPQMRLSIKKPAPHKASLKDIKNYPTI